MTDFAAPWIVIPPPEGRGVGPVRCAQCHAPAHPAPEGNHWCTVCPAVESPAAVDLRAAELVAAKERIASLEAALFGTADTLPAERLTGRVT